MFAAVNKQYKELFSLIEDVLKDNQKKGISFEERFKPHFPPGYIEREPGKAREIITALIHIPQSDTIRLDLPPVCCYVMYNLIVEFGPFVRLTKEEWCSDELKQYMNALPRADDNEPVDQKYIRQWFRDIGIWVEDFELTYDSDNMHLEFIETAGELYLLNNEQSRRVFNALGVDIEALSDLMPFDLRNRVLKKIEGQEKIIPNLEEEVLQTILVACEKLAANPVDTRGLEEDALNRRVRDYIEMALERVGYVIKDTRLAVFRGWTGKNEEHQWCGENWLRLYH